LHSLSANSETDAALSLLSAQAVRERAHRMLAIGLDGKLPHFHIDLARLPAAVDLVLEITRKNYPSLDVPFHSRWRHFVRNGEDRWAALNHSAQWRAANARGRAAFDLAIVSVLLDAGAGPQWRYRDAASGQSVGRSEGLALASLAMFAQGAFSSDPKHPLQADAEGLQNLSNTVLAAGFQASEHNPLVGIEGRAELLRRLGKRVTGAPDIFSRDDVPRPGGLFDHFAALAASGEIAAPTILAEVLRHLGPIWPSRLTLGGVPLGDCWRHPSLVTGDATNELVPLHKLSQWLSYSLIEPLQWAGIAVSDIDGLTGLSEYRNGGLFIDAGVLALRDAAETTRAHTVDSPLVVEWRTLTVALLDRLADEMRRRLDMDAKALPLAKVLEGGTWAAGRVIARQKRGDGSPPLKIISDGTVF
jgi:Protein of unknown function (DUF1688)